MKLQIQSFASIKTAAVIIEGGDILGKADIYTKGYTEDPHIFADAFNCMIHKGEQVIDPEKLHPMDSTVVGVPYGSSGAEMPVQKFRDGLKYLTQMEDERNIYLILGIEDQTNVNYAMPVKDMVYDALQYASQIENAARSRREERKEAGRVEKEQKEWKSRKEQKEQVNSGEYLTGFYKDDRLIPVITQVIYLSPDRWDGPRSLHEMLLTEDPEILSFVPNYRINLLSPAEMTDEEIDRFQTSLREVMKFIKYSKDKKKLLELVGNDERFHSLDYRAARVINAVTGSKLKFGKKEETPVSMCKAISDLREEERSEGRKEGRKEGILSAFRKMSAYGMTASAIADLLNEPLEFVTKALSVSRMHPGWDERQILEEISQER